MLNDKKSEQTKPNQNKLIEAKIKLMVARGEGDGDGLKR